MSGELQATLTTRHLPPIAVDSAELLAPSTGETPWWQKVLGRIFRPKLVVRHPFGTWTRAPYGEPGRSTWPALAVVVGILPAGFLVLGVYGFVQLVRRRKRRR